MVENKLIFILFFVIANSIATEVFMHCQYKLLHGVYFCDVTKFQNDRKHILIRPLDYISSIAPENDGKHLLGKNSDDVRGLQIKNIKMNFLPENIENRFKNIEKIIIDETELLELHSWNLKPFQKLNTLEVSGNFLQEIEKDLFVHNRKLQKIKFYNNKIKFIHPTVFEDLPANVSLHENYCISKIFAKKEDNIKKYLLDDGKCVKNEFLLETKTEKLAKNLNGEIKNLHESFSKFESQIENISSQQKIDQNKIEIEMEKMREKLNELEKIEQKIENLDLKVESFTETLNKEIKKIREENEKLKTENGFKENSKDEIIADKFHSENDENDLDFHSLKFNIKDYIYISIFLLQMILIILLFIKTKSEIHESQPTENLYSNDTLKSGQYHVYTLPHEKSMYEIPQYEEAAIDSFGPTIDVRNDFKYASTSGIENYAVDYEMINYRESCDKIKTPIYSKVNKKKSQSNPKT